jgi:chemotaxis protein MotB
MVAMAKGRRDGATIVLKRIEEGGHGHHGGAWKVAYADFVTAMMAFFLLMWLLNATTEEQRRGIADFFNPTNVLAQAASGTGQPFGGRTPHSPSPMVSDGGTPRIERGARPVLLDIEEDGDEPDPPPMRERQAEAGSGESSSLGEAGRAQDPGRDASPAGRDAPAPVRDASAAGQEVAARAEAPPSPAAREQAAFERSAEALRDALRADPRLQEVARQVLIELVPEGLRIQLLEADGQPMFALGDGRPTERARLLIQRVAEAARGLPNPLAITGHTDATPFRGPGRSNWDLSAERANTTRRLLQEAGIPDARLRGVTGMADRELLRPERPNDPGNRRVAVTLLREAAP